LTHVKGRAAPTATLLKKEVPIMDMHESGNLMQKFRHPLWLVWLALAVAGGYYLMTRHEQHLLQVLPYLIFLACPLMHIFMHGGHGGHHHRDASKTDAHGPRDN
jgi:hypothetical protein